MSEEMIISIFFIAIGVVVLLCKNNTNHILGYRTYMSMKNQSNWHYAQIYSGKRILILGVILLILLIIAPLFEINTKLISTLYGIGIGVGTLLIIVATEIALNKKEKEKEQ
ncbi:SdpI family protein [Myroides guanonis]|uniref:SdpI/YhfL protein family protein n=1 Tax=Myroides guanonis TaxID=1150112 RepID=A0A1I3P6N2_9FLAO|nr:SdpI family protein [Myroides guanonis]SFJ17208.1 SdpI/YhfL protein family protein [Myroides guanonis]